MSNTVSFTDFRKNLSNYIELLAKGEKITVRDEKKDKNLVTVVAEKKEEFDWDLHLKWIKSVAGSGLLASKEDEIERKKFRKSFKKRLNEAKLR